MPSKGKALDDNKCDTDDRMISSEVMPTGRSMPWFLMNPEDVDVGSEFYTTRVQANSVDDNGEAYYTLEGTGKTFTICGSKHVPGDYPWHTVVELTGMSMGQREHGDLGEKASMTLVLTGSESYEYTSSFNFGFNNLSTQKNGRSLLKLPERC